MQNDMTIFQNMLKRHEGSADEPLIKAVIAAGNTVNAILASKSNGPVSKSSESEVD